MAARAQSAGFSLVSIKDLLLTTFTNFSQDAVPRLSAAFSFYAMLSMAPLLVLAIVVAGLFLGEGNTRETILREVQAALGTDSRAMVENLIDNTTKPGAGMIATVISLGITFFSASNLFIQLKDTFRAIWSVEPETVGFLRSFLVARLFAFAAVLVFGCLVLAWLFLDSWLAWVQKNTQAMHLGQWTSFIGAALFLWLMFAISYRFFPHGKVQWRDVWIGAGVAALGVALGKLVLSEYFSRIDVAGAYGPAGALVVILLWIYYTSQIYFFGAELVYTYAHMYGSRTRVEDNKAITYS